MASSVDAPNAETGRTPLMDAALKGDNATVLTLVSEGADTNLTDAHHNTAILLAAEKGFVDIVCVLAPVSGVDTQDLFGRAPLHWAAKRRDITMMRALIVDGRADVNLQTTSGDTPLHWCCTTNSGMTSGGRAPAVTLLLEQGANPLLKNKMEQSVTEVLASTLSSGGHSVPDASDFEAVEEALMMYTSAAEAVMLAETSAGASSPQGGGGGRSGGSSPKMAAGSSSASSAAAPPPKKAQFGSIAIGGGGGGKNTNGAKPGASSDAKVLPAAAATTGGVGKFPSSSRGGGALVGSSSTAAKGGKKKLVIKMKK